MAAAKVQVRLSGRFPAGTIVELREVVAGALPGGPPLGRIVTRSRTSEDSMTVFEDGVQEGRRYVAVANIDGNVRSVNVTGKVQPDSRFKQDEPGKRADSGVNDGRTSDDFDAHDEAAVKRFGDPAGERDALIAPGNMPRQDEASGVLQRSNTPLGEAVPKDRDETVPYPDQESEEFSSGKVVQRSDTPFGMATPIPDVPRTQAEARERGVWQASDTPVGEATPLRDGGPVKDRLAQDSPAERVGDIRVDPAPAPGAPADPKQRSREDLLAAAEALGVQNADAQDDAQLASTVLERESARGTLEADGDEDGDEELTKEELMELAREQDIAGRSSMSKDELAAAVRRPA